uniref:Uncharacterized protein n=1 Tax=Glossina austeni TaxID=7395 RepID=A0A1A9VX32_GLOAU
MSTYSSLLQCKNDKHLLNDPISETSVSSNQCKTGISTNYHWDEDDNDLFLPISTQGSVFIVMGLTVLHPGDQVQKIREPGNLSDAPALSAQKATSTPTSLPSNSNINLNQPKKIEVFPTAIARIPISIKR